MSGHATMTRRTVEGLASRSPNVIHVYFCSWSGPLSAWEIRDLLTVYSNHVFSSKWLVKMTGEPKDSVFGLIVILAGHCPLTSRYFELCSETLILLSFPVCMSNIRGKWLQYNLYMLFTGWQVRTGKNCALGLEYAVEGRTEGTVFRYMDGT